MDLFLFIYVSLLLGCLVDAQGFNSSSIGADEEVIMTLNASEYSSTSTSTIASGYNSQLYTSSTAGPGEVTMTPSPSTSSSTTSTSTVSGYNSQLYTSSTAGPGEVTITPSPSTSSSNTSTSTVSVLDYLDKFELGMSSSSESSPVCLVRNGVSKPINIPTGFPMGSATHRRAFVGTNGAISFESVFYDRWPRPFPMRWWNRDHNVVAPFWSDNDIRLSGQVCYEVYEGDTNYLSTVNEYISMKTKKEFKGQWMLLAEWDKVHPYPDGQWWWNWYSSSIKEFTKLENTYQAIVVTDGLTSYSLFTYKCNELQWSGYWRHATVGYNAAGDFYTNHPLSGYSQVKELGCIGSESTEVNNLLYQISLSPDFIQRKRVECRNMLREDEEMFGNVTAFSKQLQPCPCTMRQSWWDRRYRSDWNSWSSNWNHLCFRERFPNPVNDGSQYCCYKTSLPGWGSLKHFEESGTYGTNMLRYHPRYYSSYDKYDRKLRETCCTHAGLCNEFYKRRPQNNCQGYQPPPRRWGGGDPHITSLDGLMYTFNGLGEYRMVEIDQHQFKMYGRTGKVEGGTKATEFVAFAFAVGNNERVEIQNHKSFAVFHNSSNITDQLSQVNDTYTSDDKNIEIERAAENSVEITFHFGLSITVNISVGILHYTIAMPNSIEGLATGLLGNFNGNSTDDLLSPNATEYNVTNEKDVFVFGESWKVLSVNQSIFMIPNPDPDPSFMPDFVEDVVSQANQLVVDACNGDQQCIYDAIQTNNLEVGMATSAIQQNITKEMELINNFPPVMNGSSSFELQADELSSYTFSVNDTDNFNITVDAPQLDNGYILTDNQDGTWTFECTWTHSDTRNFTATFIATDSLGSSSILEPKVFICACVNDGTCTTTDTDLSSNPVIFSCECDEDVWSGEFCEEDTDGCETFSCYTGVECQDNPAPQTGATCGDCPIGFSGDGTACDDIDECEKSLCEQDCTNTEGSYTCMCFDGYLETNGSCKDINECEGYNECHQECTNTVGSYECSCFDGFILSSDKRSCIPENPCNNTYELPILCTLLHGEEKFACIKGYSYEGLIYCKDVDECLLKPCDQLCINSRGSFTCYCNYGFNLGVNNRSCTDIDECLEAALNGKQLCSNQLMCVNTEGDFNCSCPDGTTYNTTSQLCEVVPLTTTSPTTSPPSTRSPVSYKLLLSEEAIIGISVGGGLLLLFLVFICTVISYRSSLSQCHSKVYPGSNNIEHGETVLLMAMDIKSQSGDEECISSKSGAAVSVATQTSVPAISRLPPQPTVSNMPGQACVEVETRVDTSLDDEHSLLQPKR